MLEPGLHYGIPEDEYHALPYVSHSDLKLLAREGAAAYEEVKANGKESTEPQKFGTALHVMLLEPKTFWDRYIIDRTGLRRNSNAWKEWRDAQTKLILRESDYERFVGIVRELAKPRYDNLRALVRGAEYEVTAIWDDPQLRVRSSTISFPSVCSRSRQGIYPTCSRRR